MVGGLADWFAVTALFKRPLGIPSGKIIRTEIIPLNRKRLFDALIKMVTGELLTKENIFNKIAHYDIPELLFRYLEEHDGKKKVKIIFSKLVKELLSSIEPQSVGVLIENIIKDNIQKLRISPLIIEAIDYSLKNSYEEKIIDFALDELIRLSKEEQMHDIIYKLISEAIDAYEKDMDRRKFADWVSGISPNSLVEATQEKLTEFLIDIKVSKTHVLREKIKKRILDFVDDLRVNEDLQSKIEKWKNELVLNKLKLSTYIAEITQSELEAAPTKSSNINKTLQVIGVRLDEILQEFKENTDQRKRMDNYVKSKLMIWIGERHSELGGLVEESLDKLSNEMLVKFIEEKAGNDLQMIRINGSLVGGVIGILIYLIVWVIEKVTL